MSFDFASPGQNCLDTLDVFWQEIWMAGQPVREMMENLGWGCGISTWIYPLKDKSSCCISIHERLFDAWSVTAIAPWPNSIQCDVLFPFCHRRCTWTKAPTAWKRKCCSLSDSLVVLEAFLSCLSPSCHCKPVKKPWKWSFSKLTLWETGQICA